MTIAFMGMVSAPMGDSPADPANLVWMLAWQAVLGLSLGLIYAGSIYFGMVLDDGSAEQGALHEAMIGLGSAVGPAAGLVAQWLFAGSLAASVGGVGVVLVGTLVTATVAAVRMRRTDAEG